ncbi:type V CRISPR-associated protein Cpf1 [Candidatus Campbellbacteria bacterium RIFCSPLOWO2_01_FULL_34_15]|uniref:Type V CRISPR-associated protein Cpf1 n=1 Tax=Candidatus Campbellbacteria bacterium RIFCSPLOWO2_01_FULL_34_15 TaxID=1797579 RepID=A0A1F5ENJ2_9BACT|nr:MAG: type V CRISPR-associated protein Cpf1 [Candidatus Campbellbacteria bacterium RIFCSPLOWO2_01_FULL_34_15]
MKKEKEFKSFGDFTNLYEISKTLRFELKPVENTQTMLDEADVFGKDKVIKDKYTKTKPFIDKLHREFVDESLKDVSLSGLKKYSEVLENWKKNKKDKDIVKELKKEEERLRKEVVEFFDNTAKKWANEKYKELGLKKKDIGILFEESVFDLLKEKYGEEQDSFLKEEKGDFLKNEKGEKVSIFDEWKGFVGYFTKFQETRKNFYKNDGTETALATRIIDQNLKRFCDNIDDFKKIKNKIDFSEVEKNFNKTADVFSLDFYNQCLLQKGIDSYNEFIGGKTLENGKKLKGVNELVNEYRQKNKNEKVSFLKLLDKQILSEKEKLSFGIENDEQLLVVLNSFYETAEEKTKILRTLFGDFVEHNENYDLDKTYISKVAFNTISHKWTNETHKFEELLYGAMKEDKPIGLNYDKKEDSYKFPDFIALGYLKKCLNNLDCDTKFWKEKYYENNADKKDKDKGFLTGGQNAWDQFLQIFIFEFNQLFNSEAFDNKGKEIKIGYDNFRKDFEEIINQKDFKNDENLKIAIKNFADSVLWIYQMAKYFAIEKKRGWDDDFELSEFYTNPSNGYSLFYDRAYEEIVQKYNDLRNYLTKKPYKEDKWKLNFENPTLANGFDKNKESDNSTVILRKKRKYYLGLMKKGNNKIFEDRNKAEFIRNIESGAYEKMAYKYLPDVAKMIPKCSTQLNEAKNHFRNSADDLEIKKSFSNPLKITKRIFDLNNIQYDKTNVSKKISGDNKGIKIFQKEYYKISGDFDVYKSALNDWIDFCKDFLSKYDSTKDFDFSILRKTKDYKSLDEFYVDVAKITYKISFTPVSESYIDQKNKNGELYLFEIYNQDFAKGKMGAKNLHTLYFENVFSPENISKNFPIKLNGNAELFFRPKSIESKKEKRNFVREIVNKKRYSEDKIFFHCPITLNRETGSIYRFNNYVNNFLSENNINIIGVDRGEKHLAYYSVIDKNGVKIGGGSFNEINKVDYAKKLEERAGEREQSRKDWQVVEGIKDLKKGYISQVVRELADLAIKHNAIIVLEDLNMRFKQIRGGIEKSIYQQLEKALIDKLSFLVEKGEKDPNQAGHILKAYQLAAPFTSFKDMGKQTGIVFYTQASYTSKTCPNCGFRKNNNKFYFENNIGKAQDALKKLKTFEYDSENKCFGLSYCLSDFANKEEVEKNKNKKRNNAPYSDIEKKDCFELSTKDAVRYRWHDKNTERGKTFFEGESVYEEKEEKEIGQTKRGLVKEYDISKCLIGLFEKTGLDYKQNLLDKINSGKFDGTFYKNLFNYLNLLFEIRNSISGTEIDYISCPECQFHTDKSKTIKNGDDNGSYNIARKGMIILDKIKQFKKENGSLDKMGWGELFIDLEEWDKFAQKKNNNIIDK